MRKNENRLLIVLLSFLLVGLVEFLDWPFYQYYTALGVTCLVLIYLSTRKSDPVLLLYAFIQLALLVSYVGLNTHLYLLFDWIIYYSPVNLCIIVLSFELAILCYSGGACVRLAISRYINGMRGGCNHIPGVKKVNS